MSRSTYPILPAKGNDWTPEPPVDDGFYWIFNGKWNDLHVEHLIYAPGVDTPGSSDGKFNAGIARGRINPLTMYAWTSHAQFVKEKCFFKRMDVPQLPPGDWPDRSDDD